MRNKFFFLSIFFLLLALGATWLLVDRERGKQPNKKLESIKDAFEWEFERTKDPALGYPPVERLLKALEQTRRKQAQFEGQPARGPITNPKWRERGPNNIGGRTRVIHIDLNDPTRNTVWAAGVAGGLWKSSNIDADDPQWQKINDYMENMAIGALAQDPSNPQIMYAGTGEGYSNWEAVAGLGLFRSTDGGDSWHLLPSTLNGNFRYSRELIVTPGGDAYVATSEGLYRSQDHGDSWLKVLGSGLGANDEMYDVVYTSAGLFASNVNHIFRSPTGDPSTWQKLTKSPVPTSFGRLEMAVCQADPNVIYCIGVHNGGASPVYASTDGGQTWTQRALPANNNGSEFTNGQAWYDLEIAVDPSDCNHVIAGGVPIRRSVDGALSWAPLGDGIHVDQHVTVFDEQNPNEVYFGNDGGIYRVIFGNGSPVTENKNFGYNVTQYYACEMHPDTFSSYFLGGTQDNGSHQMQEWNITSARNVWGGDGFMCHIDQDEPHIQLVSSQYGNWGISFNGGLTWDGGNEMHGGFFNPSDYDDDANILYAETDDGDFYRWNINDATLELVDVSNLGNFDVSHIRVDHNVPNRIYIGTGTGGQIIRIDNAHTGETVTGQSIGSFSGTVSSIDIEAGNPDHILVTLSNYGLANSIWETKNGGANWTGVEGTAVPDNLPDMPVRWGIFSPIDATQAMIATEAGVWTTELLDGNQTVWIPPMPDRGIPLVRTDMLVARPSDKMVLASTHARGMFTTDVFCDPIARMDFPKVHYINSAMTFQGDLSLGVNTFAWDLGDGTTATEENVQHVYTAPGTYPVSLTVDGTLNISSSVKILPERPLPYIDSEAAYGGDFEGLTEQYGVYHIQGTSFERGKSTLPYRDGTHSGENAFVVGMNGPMQHNTHTMLYLPKFDLSEPGIYEFSFWGKFDLEAGKDGFRVEYSTDGGHTWGILGANVKKNWYNTTNTGLDTAVFPEETSYFSKREADFTRYFVNISDLGGKGMVAFRFVVKSNLSGTSGGVAIDDVTITSYLGALATELIEWEGEFSGPTEITLSWKTRPEYYCRRFEVERSENGKDFIPVHTTYATGVLTDDLQDYSYSLFGQKNLFFFRLKVINLNTDPAYSYEFYSPIITVRRKLTGTEVFKAFPNPFTNYADITFTDVVSGLVKYDLFNYEGRFLSSGEVQLDGGAHLRVDMPSLAPGVYFLRIKIGEQEAETIKLLKVS